MDYIWYIIGVYMPKRRIKIIRADKESIILEVSIGTDYRITIPKAIRHMVDPKENVQITIKKVRGR